MDGSLDPSVHFLESTRFWVQRVFVPIFVFIGVGGNGVTIMVFTRRRMRCTTNIYLTALAVADLIYLLFVLLLSFQHYPNIHEKKYELYWRFYGITHWLCDAASSTSVWLTVSFTVERYIAVCHPIRGKVLCTENRAKSIIALVSILCIMTTASTTFEHQLTLKERCIKKCDINDYDTAQENSVSERIGNNGVIHYMPYHNIPLANIHNSVYPIIFHHNGTYPNLTYSLDNAILLRNVDYPDTPPVIYVPYYSVNGNAIKDHHKTLQLKLKNNTNVKQKTNVVDKTVDVITTKLDGTSITNETKKQPISPSKTEDLLEHDTNIEKPPCNSSNTIQEDCQNYLSNNFSDLNENDTFNLTCCEKTYSIDTEATNLGKNKTYKTVMYWFSSVFFGLLPLTLIATFNCFLIHAVYKSQRTRKHMTNSSIQENVNMTNENRITLLLIGIIIIFLICQTPTASFLIYEEFNDSNDEYTKNIKKGLGNIFNFLLTLNASCNFLLYCVLSGKYRRTFKTLFCERKLNRQDTLALSLTRRSTQRFNPHKNGFRRNASEYFHHTPRNLETQSLSSMPRSKSLIARSPGKAKSSDLNI